MLRTTPFHARTSALCLSHAWRRWAGYVVASAYGLNHEHEYHAIRSSAALLDISPLYKYLIEGRDAARLLDRVVTRNVSGSVQGQVLYTSWCDSAGKVLDDGTVSRLDAESFRITSAEPNLRWLQDNGFGLDVRVQDISVNTAALAVQGPSSRAVLQEVADIDISGIGYFRVAGANIAGVPVTISRTGYTGDLGYEVWLHARDALAVWDTLVETGASRGIVPAGMLALDVARIEAGLMLLDVDYVPARKALTPRQASSPFELDLGWTVDLKKDNFVGRAALEAEARRTPEWSFVGIEVEWDSLERLYAQKDLAPQLPGTPWRTSTPIYAPGGEQAGYATSGTWSPLLKKYIALAHLRARWAAPGTPVEFEVTVEHVRRRAAARVVRKPFFNPVRKRS